MSKRVEAALVWWEDSGFMKYRIWELEQETRQERTNNSSTYSYPIGGTNTEEVTRWVKKTLLREEVLSNAEWGGSTKAEALSKLDDLVAPYVTDARPKRRASDV
tara:strand:- start:293 stop:604 length:312 start_codon:yes stop_codon:yes gene_type:complete